MKWKYIIARFTENWFAKVMSFALAVLLFQFYRGSLLDKRYIIVPLTIQNHGKLVPAENYPRRIKVLLWGKTNTIESIHEDDVHAFIDLSRFKIEGSYQLPIQVRVNGASTTIEPFEASAEPDSLSLRLEKSMTKQIPIILSLRGIPADGYEVNESSIDPSTIEIYGPEALIKKIDSLATEPLFIEDRTNGFSGTVSIVNEDPLITVRGKTQTQYTVKINEVTAVKKIEHKTLVIKNAQPMFTITVDPHEGSVEIQGKKRTIETWQIPDDLLTVSAASITEPGVYILPVVPNLVPDDRTKIKIMRFSPKSAKLTVELKQEEEIDYFQEEDFELDDIEFSSLEQYNKERHL